MSLSNLPLLRPTAEPCADPIVERNVSLLRQRSTVGVQKYGTTLADNKLPLRAWLNHALEEVLDQANYLQAAMAEIDSAAGHQIADATEDAELLGIGYLVDGVNVHPSRVTVLRPAAAPQGVADNPMEWPIPCDVTVGAGTIKKGVSFRAVVARMKVLHGMAMKAAAPVQAQEPFAWYVETEGVWGQERFTQIDPGKTYARVTPLYTAPVQPVAVPDEEEFGFKAVRLRRTAFLLGLEGAIPDNDKDLMDCMGAVLGMICREVERLAAPAAQGDALNVAQIEDGYEGGTCIADPTRLGGTVHLHYISPEHAESAFEVIAEIIDAAIAAKEASTPQ